MSRFILPLKWQFTQARIALIRLWLDGYRWRHFYNLWSEGTEASVMISWPDSLCCSANLNPSDETSPLTLHVSIAYVNQIRKIFGRIRRRFTAAF